ncbi:MAG: HAD-IA family hydrolase [Candidatus Latescibacteria bacterium]|jgi:phosphoglycolate phosphatase|nr:HAD-IA family hydrolase [Candidatus Latescibacterota bacterium]MBT4138794.1 HAD-IA family hydrolase [Candidatus Latescibacterota bacterium]MBT5829988.1 HAD-IA family hydrolase [Candidatus Latescibacterota bacterium]
MKDPVVIFDFDGTIADTLELLFVIGNEMATEFKFKSVSRDQIEINRTKSLRQLIRELEVPVLKIPTILLKSKTELNNRIQEVEMIEGITDLLFRLKEENIRLGLVSTNSEANIHSVLKNHGLENVFDFISVCSGLFGKARVLRRVMKTHHFNAKQMLYVGDEIRDIEAARRSGIPIVSVTWGYNSSEVLEKHAPDYLIDHPREIIQILEKQKKQTENKPSA